eukprot:TRINITY_DN90561_c0_g1_i1.p1 TRINITY_DN90561_c0_g1~~TRINITY_DN90561_c0_g1_i1.p1  ORF type:complete len:817 (-),score=181.16 TRINITY_DN90561_c0_g1_i1:12-2462(-)
MKQWLGLALICCTCEARKVGSFAQQALGLINVDLRDTSAINAVFDQLDTDFDDVLCEDEIQARVSDGRATLQELDGDGDGVVSRKEFAAAAVKIQAADPTAGVEAGRAKKDAQKADEAKKKAEEAIKKRVQEKAKKKLQEEELHRKKALEREVAEKDKVHSVAASHVAPAVTLNGNGFSLGSASKTVLGDEKPGEHQMKQRKGVEQHENKMKAASEAARTAEREMFVAATVIGATAANEASENVTTTEAPNRCVRPNKTEGYTTTEVELAMGDKFDVKVECAPDYAADGRVQALVCKEAGGMYELHGCAKGQYECSVGEGKACHRCKQDRTAADQCAECNPGYTLTSEFTCRPFRCSAEHSANCKHCKVQRMMTADDQCGECKRGFKLDGDSHRCLPYVCDVGVIDDAGHTASCAICRPPAERTVDQQCVQCRVGYEHLEDYTCRPYTCELDEIPHCSKCQEQEDRTDVNQCKECDPGYELSKDADKCEKYQCEEGPDSKCQACMELSARTGHGQCKTCNAGYRLTAEKACEMYSCSETSSGEGCKTCVDVKDRLGDDECASCHSGYYLEDKVCMPWNCEVGKGPKCRSCPVQRERTAENQCLRCNAGYVLDAESRTCLPIQCEEGKGILCKTCRYQEARTQENQCSTCNQGYGLRKDLSCSPFTCETGEGPACKSCKVQRAMTGFNQCASCNPGFVLGVDFTCKVDVLGTRWDPHDKAVLYTKQVVRDLIKKLDKNLDGKLSKDEMDAGHLDDAIKKGVAGLRGGIIRTKPTSVSVSHPDFINADLDGDGQLSREEFKALERERLNGSKVTINVA